MPSLSKKSMPKLVHHKNKLEACSFNLCRKVFLKISPHFSSQTAITTNTKGSSIKDVRIYLSVFDTPLPHVGILTLIYLTIPSNILQHRNLRTPPPLKYSEVFYGWPQTQSDFAPATLKYDAHF